MDNIVKLYGLDHSGSHYLAYLLHNNFPNMVVLHSHTGWNHGKIVDKFNWDATEWNTDPHFNGVREKLGELVKREPLNSGKSVTHYKNQIKHLYKNETLPLLILIRNPFDWLYSYNIKHYHGIKWKTLQNTVKLWSEINRDYFTHWWPKKHFIKYENLRDNTQEELNKISNFLGINLLDDFIDTDLDAVSLSNDRPERKFEMGGGKERCIKEHQKMFGITPQEFEEIFEENIDKEVLNTYIGL